MRTKLAALAAAVGMAGATVAFLVLPSSADEPPAPITVEPLTPRSEFTDDVTTQIKLKLDGKRTTVLNSADPSRVVTAKITVQPGARFPWHTHPGPVIVNVTQGELIYVNADDCVERPYAAGTLFIDPGRGNVHTAFNPTDTVTVVMATFFEAPETGPLTITEGIEEPENCHVPVGAHSH